MRYPDGGGLTAAGRKREEVRLSAAEMSEHDMEPVQVAHEHLLSAAPSFEDEAGQTLRPPKARTWGRRGRTPMVAVSGKGSGRGAGPRGLSGG
jgi:hypothetical protein